MDFLRTPDSFFRDIGFDFEPHYVDVSASDGTALRMHYIDEGPQTGQPILCLHGQPSWSFLYRDMIGPLVAAGFRVIAPDLIGFGKSDKPVNIADYSYPIHVAWIEQFLVKLELSGINGLFQDWGGMIGMRLVARHSELFSRIVVTNTMLLDSSDISPETSKALAKAYATLTIPTAEHVRDRFAEFDPMAAAYWVKYAAENPAFSVRDVFSIITGKHDEAALKGYEAPFPNRSYLTGPLSFPSLFPVMPHHQVDREENDRVWRMLSSFTKPVLTAFSDGDPVTRGHDRNFRDRIPGAKRVEHVTVRSAGHFLQDEQPKQLSDAVIRFIAQTGSHRDVA